MNRKNIAVLFIHNNDENVVEIVRNLKEGGLEVDWSEVNQFQVTQEIVSEKHWDCVVTFLDEVNNKLPELLALLNSINPRIPVILVHDLAHETQAVNLVASDAQVSAAVYENNLSQIHSVVQQQIKTKEYTSPKSPQQGVELDPEQYRKFVEVAREGIWAIDADSNTTYVNPAMARMFGYTAEEMIGKPLFYFMDEKGVEICKRNLKRREEGIEEQHDFEFLRKDGSRIYTTLEVAPFMEDGQYKGGVAGVIDITPKHQAEMYFRRTLRALITTRACVARVSRATEESKLLYDICKIVVDKGGYRMAWVGYAENDETKTVRPVAQSELAKEYLENMQISWADTSQGQGPTGTAIRTANFDVVRDIPRDPRFKPWRETALKYGYVSSIALPLISEGRAFGALNIYAGHVDAFDSEEQQLLQELADDLAFGIMALRNRSARLQAEAELVKYQEHLEELVAERTSELERSNSELESFSYSVSHDLRSPLRHINGYSHLLQDEYADKLDENGLDYLCRMQEASRRMGNLIDHMLELARLNQQDLKLEKINLSEIAIENVKQLQEHNSGRKVQIDIAKNVTAIGDRKLLSLVLQNLLGNAWKFTAKVPHPRIEFGVSSDDNDPVYFVRDNGVGFDMKYINKLFGTFQRLHHEDEFEGAGIGLASVQRIIDRHGGRVWAEGVVGKGATLFFTLRRAEY